MRPPREQNPTASTRLRVLIVDDEPIARRVLREELEEITDVEIVGEAESGREALKQILELAPDLVFLDLQMPGMGGFEVVANLDDAAAIHIVIVTAFDRYAIEAFEAGALDYLLKPVSQERLAKCLARVRKLRQDSLAVAESMARLQEVAGQALQARPRKIVGKLGEEYHLLDSRDVLAFQAEREVVWIVTHTRRYLATQPLKRIQEKLRDANFSRIHRNTLVNLDRVAKMAPLSSKRWLLTLDNQQEFIVSKRQARAVLGLINW